LEELNYMCCFIWRTFRVFTNSLQRTNSWRHNPPVSTCWI